MRPAERADRELLLRDRALAGDARASEELLEPHLDALYDFIHWRVGSDRALAEDVVQETMLVAVDRLASFDGRSSFHTWLCGIARNKLRAHRRKRRAVPVADLLLETDDEIDAILARIDSEPLPDEVLERAETQELVGAALSSLPADYREALVGKYVEGRSVRELARRRDGSEKAAESLLGRARLAFGEVFQLLAKRRGGIE